MSDVDLADLEAFAAVARARSFRGAATLRGVSASSLSEALRRLEARLGVRLLNRTTRSVTPTEAGERLIERLAPALGEIAGALDAVTSVRDSPAGAGRSAGPPGRGTEGAEHPGGAGGAGRAFDRRAPHPAADRLPLPGGPSRH